MKEFFQFNLETSGCVPEIATPIYLSKPDSTADKIKCSAIWDTGATSSMISAAIAKKLALASIGTTQIAGVHGVSNAKCYQVDITFGNGFCLQKIKVSEASDFGGFDLLVGMDIIGHGIMILDGTRDKKLCVHFQIPTENNKKIGSF